MEDRLISLLQHSRDRDRSNAEGVRGKASLEFHLELRDLFNLKESSLGPLDHFIPSQDARTISGAYPIQMHVVGLEPRAYGRIHRVCHRESVAEQVGAAPARQALAPDLADSVDVDLRARPDFEAGPAAAEIHRQ